MSYLTIISAGPKNWNALVPELSCIITGKDREDLLRLSRESIAIALDGTEIQGATITSVDQLDPELRADLPEGYAVEFLEPTPMNPVSEEIRQALEVTGVSQAELARRLGTSRSAVSRLVNPFYWGHSLDVLRRVAQALDAALEVHITRKAG